MSVLNIFDAEDAFLEAQADFDEFMEEFEREWFAPLGETQFAMLMQATGEERMKLVREKFPGVMGKLEERFEQMKKRGGKDAEG